jgi:hypothetical protein
MIINNCNFVLCVITGHVLVTSNTKNNSENNNNGGRAKSVVMCLQS